MTLPPALAVPVTQEPLRPGDWRLAAWRLLVDAVAPGVYQVRGHWSAATPEVPEEVWRLREGHRDALVFALGDYGEPGHVAAFLDLATTAPLAMRLLLERVAALEADFARAIAARDAAWEPETGRRG